MMAIVGVPGEIKTNESRVAITPSGVDVLVRRDGHTLLVERGAGVGSGFEDDEYVIAGATLLDSADEIWAGAELIMKVKEPLEAEYGRLRRNQVIFSYFHFAADESLTRTVMRSGAVAIAYETVQLASGELPLLTPMSEVAGRMAVQAGARYLESYVGGRGILLGGVPGVSAAEVVVLGGGVVGMHAARIAAGMGARVTILDVSLPRLRHLSAVMPSNVSLIYSTRHNILDAINRADLVIGAVLLPGSKPPKLIGRGDLRHMKKGAVIVDVSVDQGGCVETIHPTTHADPVYEIDGVIHYGVANMPGAVPRTSTLALTNATLPYAVDLARLGWWEASKADASLRSGLNIVNGQIVHPGVADGLSLPVMTLDAAVQAS